MYYYTKIIVIFTVNHSDQLIEGIHKKCIHFDLEKSIEKEKYINFFQKILKTEKKEIDKSTLTNIISTHNHDIRKILNMLEMYFLEKNNVIVVPTVENTIKSFYELFQEKTKKESLNLLHTIVFKENIHFIDFLSYSIPLFYQNSSVLGVLNRYLFLLTAYNIKESNNLQLYKFVDDLYDLLII
jgi:DNA polymerase III delta prime subunit